MSFHELLADYPWLVKRAAHVNDPINYSPRRHPLSWLLAIFVPRLGLGGGLAGLFIGLLMISVLAPISIAGFHDYVKRPRSAPVMDFDTFMESQRRSRSGADTRGDSPAFMAQENRGVPLASGEASRAAGGSVESKAIEDSRRALAGVWFCDSSQYSFDLNGTVVEANDSLRKLLRRWTISEGSPYFQLSMSSYQPSEYAPWVLGIKELSPSSLSLIAPTGKLIECSRRRIHPKK